MDIKQIQIEVMDAARNAVARHLGTIRGAYAWNGIARIEDIEDRSFSIRGVVHNPVTGEAAIPLKLIMSVRAEFVTLEDAKAEFEEKRIVPTIPNGGAHGKIKNVMAHFTRDLARCATQALDIVTCPGGRPKVRGMMCPHCGVDTSDGECNGVAGFVKGGKHGKR